MSIIHLIGAPLDLGAGRRGTDMGPSALRLTGLRGRLAALGHEVLDQGDLEVAIPETSDEGDPAQRFAAVIAEVCERLAARTRASVEAGAIPLTLGGDHSVAMGSIAGVAAAHAARGQQVGVIWVDAHGDMNTPETSPSGNVHGMPLAALQGRGPELLTRIGGVDPSVLPQHVALIGLRELDAREKALIRNAGVLAVTMTDIDRDGLAPHMERALAAVTRGTAGFCLSLDMDGVDPAEAPGVGTPVPGGLTYREAHLLMEMAAEAGGISAMDIVEVNPALDHENVTADLGAQLACSALGARIL